eukprot:750183-Hanusia_phi.AAC.4
MSLSPGSDSGTVTVRDREARRHRHSGPARAWCDSLSEFFRVTVQRFQGTVLPGVRRTKLDNLKLSLGRLILEGPESHSDGPASVTASPSV